MKRLALLLLLCSSVAFAGDKKSKKLDLRTAELHTLTLDGAATKLAPFAGSKATLLNLWATWCVPCRAEMPALDALQQKYKARGFQVIGLDVDEKAAEVKAFLAKNKISYPVLLSTPDVTVAALGNLEALPTSLLLDADGDVLDVIVGGIEVPELSKILEERLSATATAKPKAKPTAK